MVTLKQHYESVRGNKRFIGGTLGLLLGLASPFVGLSYIYANKLGVCSPKPSEKYARVLKVEEELNRNITMRDLDNSIINNAETLKKERDYLISLAEVVKEKQDFEMRNKKTQKAALYLIPPVFLAMLSAFPFALGDVERRRKLRELTGRK